MTAVQARPVSSFLDDVFDTPGSVRALCVLRLVLGPVALVHLSLFAPDLVDGITYEDRFVATWAPWWQPPGWVQGGLVGIGMVAAVALTAGLWARVAAAVTTACVAGNLFLSQTHFRHNRAFLIYLLIGLTIGASGRVLSVDAWRRRRARLAVSDLDTVWPIWLLRFLAASIYFSSGFSKLIDPDWSGGLVLWDRAVRYQEHVRGAALLGPLADPVADLVTARWVHALSSPVAVFIELFLAVGLWLPRTRLAAVWAGIFFHLSIELAASVEVFSLAAIGALVIWVTPATRDRTVTAPPTWLPWIRRLDWLARFELRPGDRLEVVDRDGSTRTGRDAVWLVLSRLPLSFFPAAPLRPWLR